MGYHRDRKHLAAVRRRTKLALLRDRQKLARENRCYDCRQVTPGIGPDLLCGPCLTGDRR